MVGYDVHRCLGSEDFTLEHVIPEALGGTLTCRFLCGRCNSRLGHLVESEAKADPTVRLAVAELVDRLPKLAAQLSEGQEYVSHGPGGERLGWMANGDFAIATRKLEDGSLIQPTSDAVGSIRRMLERSGHDEDAISESLRLLEQAPDNTRVSLSGGIEIVKWSIEQVRPTLDGPLLNPLVALKSAYEFLALHLNNAVYEDVPTLAAARIALAGGALDSHHLSVERLHAPEPRPIHGLVFEGSSPYTRVQVRFFGQLAFRVHFRTLAVGGPRFIYTHDLAANSEHVTQLP